MYLALEALGVDVEGGGEVALALAAVGGGEAGELLHRPPRRRVVAGGGADEQGEEEEEACGVGEHVLVGSMGGWVGVRGVCVIRRKLGMTRRHGTGVWAGKTT